MVWLLAGRGIVFSGFPDDVGDEEAKRHDSKRSASPRRFYHLWRAFRDESNDNTKACK